MIIGGDPFANIRRLVTAPVHTMRTYQIDQPLNTHYRRASCAEVECRNYTRGWVMGYDLTDPQAAAAARWIRDHSGRTFSAKLTPGKVVLTFPAGQTCFRKHRVPLQREPFYVVRNGDFRGNPKRERVVHKSADTFVDQWENDLDRLNTVRERG
jgi:hypothetical protein